MNNEQEKPKPSTPEEARRMGVDWTGVYEGTKRPNLNRPGVNHQPGPDVPKPSGRRIRER